MVPRGRQPLVWHFALTVALLCLAGGGVAADETRPPLDQRFAQATDEAADFQRHVLPLLGRLGCNGRACHGSFQGQGDFRLSLFGYDFAADHAELTAGETSRVDLDTPQQSLLLQKPTLAVEHEGGKRFERDGWQYRLLLSWIKAGAPPIEGNGHELRELEVDHSELLFDKVGASRKLTVIAEWNDGVREDVTPLCRFRTNDDSIATVDESGRVTAVGKGDTHIVVFYDNGIAPVSAMLPVSNLRAADYPKVKTPTRIDELVVIKLRKLGIEPAGKCTDAEFLRRVSLDITGTLPTPAEIRAFLKDRSANKRNKKIDELLDRPTYAAWWTTKLSDLMGNSESNLPVGGEQGVTREKSTQWYDWLYRRVAENMAYDDLVAGIVLAVSRRPEQTPMEYYAEMSAYFREQNPADITARATMPYFWTRGRFTPPQPLRFSYAFLGLRLECAQCHKHPYDQWTKDDYDGFQVFFEGVSHNTLDRKLAKEMEQSLGLTADEDSRTYKNRFAKLASDGVVVPWDSIGVPTTAKQESMAKRRAARSKSTRRVFAPRLLAEDGEVDTDYEDGRQPLMDWMREKDNPYFARAWVNRVWTHYFGLGIVNPPDDLNLANPASNEPLLAYLTESFIAHGYDMKWLHREITRSDTYQRSWRMNDTNEFDEKNFSRALVRRLPAEVAYDAIVHATATEKSMLEMHSQRQVIRDRAIGVSGGLGRFEGDYVTTLFGKPDRRGICDCDRSNEPSLLQTVYLRNDNEMLKRIQSEDGWLRQVTGEPGQLAAQLDEHIETAYLRTTGRLPTEEELGVARMYCAGDEDADIAARFGDLFWALLNTKEFILNH